ncbi:MAG: cytochrome b/b6 domain-containing protein [Acidobacteriota bacterium]|nr:cytochrome b/b6 domain-containing protein [Acidobacteriota bacterium]
MEHLEKKHLLLTRWTHWVNFPILFLMIWSGLLIYWANDVYRVGLGSVTLFHFFPNWIYNLFRLDHKLADGMAMHFLFAWIFAVNGLLYVAFTLISGQWRQVVPDRKSLVQAMQVTLHDLGLRKDCPPQGKYNGAQKIAYTAIILMGLGSLLTGLAIYRPVQLHWFTALLGGYEMARWEHFWLTMGFLAFFLIHVAQVIRAGYNNFRGMVTGWELKRAERERGNA